MPFPKNWSRQEEDTFRQWYSPYAEGLKLDPDPDNPLHYYDWRTAFRSGATPDETGHWPSDFKLKGHPREWISDDPSLKSGEVMHTPTGKIYKSDRLIPKRKK